MYGVVTFVHRSRYYEGNIRRASPGVPKALEDVRELFYYFVSVSRRDENSVNFMTNLARVHVKYFLSIFTLGARR